MTIEPLVYTGHSSNLAFYAERGKPPGYVWAEVCRNDVTQDGAGGLARLRVPTFSITIYKHGTGELRRMSYKPRARPPDGPFLSRTVTRLVRGKVAKI